MHTEGRKLEREVPWCTVFLCVGALFCHTLVLHGNLETATAMKEIGTSTAGWSRVGLGLARGFREELDVFMSDVSDKLGDAINQTLAVQKYVDIVVSLVGKSTEDAGKEVLLLQGPVDALPDAILGNVNGVMEKVMAKLSDMLAEFLAKLKPGLEMAGKMITKFGDKVTQVLESFSLSLDKVQKMFDQIMGQLNGGSSEDIKKQMMHETFTLFDVSRTGSISADDLKNVAQIYSISPLQGSKPRDLVKKYDTDGDGQLDKEEFALFVDDKSTPKSMAQVLRAYAKRLTAVAGNVASARKRDEVALAVTKYFQLVCAKNKTKLGWVADRLGNGSLPMAFTADIFKNLAQQKENPDVLTTADVGQVVISRMMELHPSFVMKSVDLMSDISFWLSEGFDPEDHPKTMERVTRWVSEAQKAQDTSLLQADNFISVETLDAMPAMAATFAEENMDRHLKAEHKAHTAHHAELFATEGSKYLLNHLLGGVAASDPTNGAHQKAKRAIDSGVPAVPETLEFAQFLAWNASDVADRFQTLSMDYTSESSSPLDSFANLIQGMVKKITGFTRLMEQYSTPSGIALLESQVQSISVKAGDDMKKVVSKKLDKFVRKGAPEIQKGLDKAVDEVSKKVGEQVGKVLGTPLVEAMKEPIQEIVGDALNNTQAGIMIGDMLEDAVSGKLPASKVIGTKVAELLNNSINDAISQAADLMGNKVDKSESASDRYELVQTAEGLESFEEMEAMQNDMHGAFDKIATLLRTFIKFLPQATDNLKFARQEVGEAAKVMDSVFANFEVKGPTIFDNIAKLWKVLWTMYFVFLLPMTLGLLYYGFWASGYFGGPKAAIVTEDDGSPQTFRMRIFNCCSACGACCTSFHDTQMCFWSFIIIFQIVCLLLFVISVVLCVFAGVKTFLLTGCSQVYLLNDESVCNHTVGLLRSFLDTFYVTDPNSPLDDVCASNQLVTCDVISSKMKSATLYTTVFSFLAALFSFQMIIESACLHTRACYRRSIDSLEAKEAS